MSDIESLPDPEDFYEYLGVAATATEAEIKKAYYSLAVKCHPDRATPETRTESTRRFQLLSRVYSVLSDPKKREIYDTTGSVDSLSSFLSMDVDWVEFWRDVFPKVTVESVAEFAGQFRGSDEERREVFDAYIQHRGDIVKIMESVTLASMLDEDRFRAMIDAGIAANELPRFAAAEASPFSAASPLRSPAARLRRGGAPASPSPIRSPGRRDVLVGSPSDSPLSSPVRASRSRRRTLLVAEEESDGDASLAEDPGPDGMAAEELEDAEPSGTLTPDLETARKRRRFAAAREAREAEQALKEIMAKRRQEEQAADDSLTGMIRSRAKARFEEMVASIEERTLGPRKNQAQRRLADRPTAAAGRKKTSHEEISEEEFMRIRSRLEKNQRANQRKRQAGLGDE